MTTPIAVIRDLEPVPSDQGIGGLSQEGPDLEPVPAVCELRERRSGRSYTGRVAKRIRFRPPGLKPTTKIGTLGPYRGRLGMAWVIAPMVVGALLLIAVGVFFLVGR
jgi:hypothetical protein